MSKPKLKWSNKSDVADLHAALKYLSLLAPGVEAQALVKSLRRAKPVDHAAKDLLRAAQLPLLPREEALCPTLRDPFLRLHDERYAQLGPRFLLFGDVMAITTARYSLFSAPRPRTTSATFPHRYSSPDP